MPKGCRPGPQARAKPSLISRARMRAQACKRASPLAGHCARLLKCEARRLTGPQARHPPPGSARSAGRGASYAGGRSAPARKCGGARHPGRGAGLAEARYRAKAAPSTYEATGTPDPGSQGWPQATGVSRLRPLLPGAWCATAGARPARPQGLPAGPLGPQSG